MSMNGAGIKIADYKTGCIQQADDFSPACGPQRTFTAALETVTFCATQVSATATAATVVAVAVEAPVVPSVATTVLHGPAGAFFLSG